MNQTLTGALRRTATWLFDLTRGMLLLAPTMAVGFVVLMLFAWLSYVALGGVLCALFGCG